MQFLLIFLLAISAAIFYGIVHDQITARICLEYFTVAHPPVFGDLQDPTLLGIGWGIIATWWVGAMLGIPLGLAARIGSMPKRSAISLLRPVAILLVCMAITALLAGLVGHWAAQQRWVVLSEPLASRIPQDKHIALLTDLWIHLASYASGFLGGLTLIVWVLAGRYRAQLMRLKRMKSIA